MMMVLVRLLIQAVRIGNACKQERPGVQYWSRNATSGCRSHHKGFGGRV